MIEVIRRYPEMAKEVIVRSKLTNPIVLKTDCNNEINEDFPIYPEIKDICQYYSVDNSEEFIGRVKAKYPEMRVWNDDIRRLMFESATFDIVMDFSTIDHIEEYNLALDQYRRILHSDGWIMVVVWLDKEFHHTPSDVNSGQYFFAENEFGLDFAARFRIVGGEDVFVGEGGYPKLSRYIGKA